MISPIETFQDFWCWRHPLSLAHLLAVLEGTAKQSQQLPPPQPLLPSSLPLIIHQCFRSCKYSFQVDFMKAPLNKLSFCQWIHTVEYSCLCIFPVESFYSQMNSLIVYSCILFKRETSCIPVLYMNNDVVGMTGNTAPIEVLPAALYVYNMCMMGVRG